jgi:hypothetical protein
MSSDFKTVLVKDPTLADITTDLVYAVKSGANSTTYQPFVATSSSNSVQVYNVQVPSENIVVGRDALISTPLQFRINISAVPVGQNAISWGQTASLQAFPLASIMNTASATINNSTTSCNLQDVLPQILRLNNNRELFRHNGMCPSLPDQEFGVYSDAFGANSSPLAGFANKSYDGDLAPRGAHPCFVQVDRYVNGVYTDHSIVSTDAVTNTWVVTVFTVSTEPIFLSPFIYADPENNKQGMLGVNNMAFTFNINSSLNRLVSYGGPGVVPLAGGVQPGVGLDPDGGKWLADDNLFRMTYGVASNLLNPPSGGPSILLRLLSSQPSDRLATRNVVPYFDLPRYLSSVNAGAAIAANTVASVTSQSIQLAQLPDYFIIVARKSMATQTVKDTSSFLTIRSISINLNNQSGLLSSASANDLWRLSTKNQSQQAFSEFCGKATVASAAGASALVPTTGSLLVISPTDLSLPDNLAPGSLGAFSMQFTAQVFNQFGVGVPNVELCVIACNSGIMVLNQGTTNIYTGMLTRDAVDRAKDSRPVLMPDRMVGGMLNRGLMMHPRRFMSGSAMSAGAQSAGAKSKLSSMY